MSALTFIEAADELRVSRRWLEYWLAAHPVDAGGNPFYVPMGRRKTFEPGDISRIRACIREEERCRLKSIGVARLGIIEARLGRMAIDSASEALARPKAKTLRRVTLPKSKRDIGKVISMVGAILTFRGRFSTKPPANLSRSETNRGLSERHAHQGHQRRDHPANGNRVISRQQRSQPQPARDHAGTGRHQPCRRFRPVPADPR